MTPTPRTPYTCRTIRSTTYFSNRDSLEAIRKNLRLLRANGTLRVTFAQGGVNEVKFEAETRINGDDHVEIKFGPGNPA